MSGAGNFFHPSTRSGKTVLAIAAIAIGVRTYQPAPKRAGEVTVPVAAEKVTRQDIPVFRVGYGTVRAFNSVVLK